jgi:hypothetical protein
VEIFKLLEIGFLSVYGLGLVTTGCEVIVSE